MLLHPGGECPGGGTAGSGEQLARGIGEGGILSRLSAASGNRQRKNDRDGSASALAPSRVGSGTARQVHTHCGRHRPDRSHRGMGVEDGLRSGASMARIETPGPASRRQRVSAPVAAGALPPGGAASAERDWARASISRIGAYRTACCFRMRKIRVRRCRNWPGWGCACPSTIWAQDIPASVT